jgi:threonine aldolase
VRSFRSDNNAGLCPEAMGALVAANDGSHVLGYGDDGWTSAAEAAFQTLFGADARAFLVGTGTAANTLAVAALTEPWQQVICHPLSHWAEHESTAPERITGCRTRMREGRDAKLWPDALEGLVSAAGADADVHEPQPGVVTLTNPNEMGLVYSEAELRALCEAAHAAGYRVHVDGARFANAVAHLGCDPVAISRGAGVDALSFGGTKNGLAMGEAVLFFPQGNGRDYRRAIERFPFLRKSTAQLVSKHRFIAAPFTAVLKDGSWLRHASHANAMATRLGEGLRSCGLEPVVAVETNGVFVVLPDAVDRALRASGHGYYGFGDPARGVTRLLCSFDPQASDVDDFLEVTRAALR